MQNDCPLAVALLHYVTGRIEDHAPHASVQQLAT
jgi:hypothetical protein